MSSAHSRLQQVLAHLVQVPVKWPSVEDLLKSPSFRSLVAEARRSNESQTAALLHRASTQLFLAALQMPPEQVSGALRHLRSLFAPFSLDPARYGALYEHAFHQGDIRRVVALFQEGFSADGLCLQEGIPPYRFPIHDRLLQWPAFDPLNVPEHRDMALHLTHDEHNDMTEDEFMRVLCHIITLAKTPRVTPDIRRFLLIYATRMVPEVNLRYNRHDWYPLTLMWGSPETHDESLVALLSPPSWIPLSPTNNVQLLSTALWAQQWNRARFWLQVKGIRPIGHASSVDPTEQNLPDLLKTRVFESICVTIPEDIVALIHQGASVAKRGRDDASPDSFRSKRTLGGTKGGVRRTHRLRNRSRRTR
jgi:hypothetical protein